MLYNLLSPYADQVGWLRLFSYITFRAAYATVTSFLIAFILGPIIIRWLEKLHLRAAIRDEVPERHRLEKGSIPSMGGIIILLCIVVPTLLWADLTNKYILIALGVTILMGGLGFLDDYIKVVKRKPLGLMGRFKLIWQFTAALGVGLFLYLFPMDNGETTSIVVPFFKGGFLQLGVLYILFVSIVIVGSSNAVNITDGLDGLACGSVAIATIAYAIFIYVAGNVKMANYLDVLYVPEVGELTVFAMAMLGAVLGFLWFNSYPAQVFMGDTGSLSLGSAIGAMAVMAKQELLLVVVGGVFVIEIMSVVLQVGYFKLTGGKRIFKMAPLHHHFELSGWAESKVTVRFWILSAVFALIAISSLKIR
jgi:phospho-N-acetylmuramoyl-pentapeptide-transferase